MDFIVMKYFIKTFGCQQNVADSERIEMALLARGMSKARSYKSADYIVVNTCMVRQSAENRIYGLVNNLSKLKVKNLKLKIILTGCLVGLTIRDRTGKYLKRLRKIMPGVDEFMSIEKIGFDYPPLRQDRISAWVPISNGCNNFCTFCVVPFTRGREISRPFDEIINECKKLKSNGYRTVTLLGQNVNSYGANLIKKQKSLINQKESEDTHFEQLGRCTETSTPTEMKNGTSNFLNKPIYVKHLGRYRIPTLFPYLLEQVAHMGFKRVDFISSNPWDFSDELINVIARNKKITRTIHLPVQSGDDNVLKRMNRWYSRNEYLKLVANLKLKIRNLKLTTDIIVGFPGETEEEFQNTVKLCKKVGFEKAYISEYSSRPFTAATKLMKDDVPHSVKKKRWRILENLINQPRLKRSFNKIN